MSVYKKHFAELEKCFVAAENLSMSRGECFTRFLNMLTAALEQANNRFFDAYDEEVEAAYMREKNASKNPSEYSRALGILTTAISEFRGDFLGEFASYIGGLEKNRKGQCFTPFGLCELLAKIMIPDDFKPQKLPLVIQEPACGGGAIIIATAERLRAVGLSSRDFYFVANDIDDKCVKMAYIQCTLLDIPAVIYTGDTLKMELRCCRPTLSFLINFADKLTNSKEVVK